MAENRNAEQNHMSNLQQDAIRRAREMQARAHAAPYAPVQLPPAEPQADVPKPHNEQMPVYPQENRIRQPQQSSRQSLDGGVLDYLFKDSERTLILVLLVLLVEEKADTELIFALMYLLM